MLKSIIIFIFICLGLQGWAQNDMAEEKRYFDEYMLKGSGYLNKLRNNVKEAEFDSTFKWAVDAFNTAMLIYPDKADEARDSIVKVFEVISNLKKSEELLRKDAVRIKDNFKNLAKNNETLAKNNEALAKKADSTRKLFEQLNLANAPYKYTRLIRDLPLDATKILEDSFAYYLIAYNNHLDTLQNLLIDSAAKMDYEILRKNLYFNNDLYEKIFFSLRAYNAETELLKEVPAGEQKQDNFRIQYLKDGSEGFSLSEDSSKIMINHANGKIEPVQTQPKGQKYTSFTLSNKSKLIFCATEDHYIVVYGMRNEGELTLTASIPMGTKVTALKFDDKKNILYFGTVRGDIGFIEYNRDKNKYQPVYDIENALIGSPITGIDVSEFIKDTAFLLATSLESKAAVYILDSNYNVPGNKFLGNHLPDPDKKLGFITHAKFDPSNKEVILETLKAGEEKFNIYYSWDPFSASALQKLKDVLKKSPPLIMENTNFYRLKK